VAEPTRAPSTWNLAVSRLAAALDRCAVALIDEILGRLREQSQGYVDENTRRARLAQPFEETWRELADILEPLVARLQGALPHIHPNQRHVGVENVLCTSVDATGPNNEMCVRDSWAAKRASPSSTPSSPACGVKKLGSGSPPLISSADAARAESRGASGGDLMRGCLDVTLDRRWLWTSRLRSRLW
jgi:hypothetical protein